MCIGSCFKQENEKKWQRFVQRVKAFDQLTFDWGISFKTTLLDPSKRASCSDLLENPWLQGNADKSNIPTEDAETIMSDLVAFQKQNVF